MLVIAMLLMMSNMERRLTMNIKNERKLQIIILAVCLIALGALLLFANHVRPARLQQSGIYYERGRVTQVISEMTDADAIDPSVGMFLYQLLEVEMLTGEFQGMRVEVHSNLMSHRLRAFESGDRVIVQLTDQFIQIQSADRGMGHFLLVAVFLLLLCVVGGKRGFFSIIGLVVSLIAILFILVPLTLAGYSAIFVAIVVGILTIITSITLLAGVNAKSISAIIGCIAGVLVAALFAFIAGEVAFVSGYHLDESGHLLMFPDLRLAGVFISGVIISAIGAISDTSMTIASAMEEVKLANPTMSMKELAKAGFNVGRDAMGTMSNTLILAFVGSSFGILLLFLSLDINWIAFINEDLISIEIIQGIAGSIGIVLTVPITTFIAAKLFSLNVNK